MASTEVTWIIYSTSQEVCTLWFVVFCFVVDYTFIFKGYFTGTGAIIDCPSASEVTLKDMGKWIIWIHCNFIQQNHTKTKLVAYFVGYTLYEYFLPQNKILMVITAYMWLKYIEIICIWYWIYSNQDQACQKLFSVLWFNCSPSIAARENCDIHFIQYIIPRTSHM